MPLFRCEAVYTIRRTYEVDAVDENEAEEKFVAQEEDILVTQSEGVEDMDWDTLVEHQEPI